MSATRFPQEHTLGITKQEKQTGQTEHRNITKARKDRNRSPPPNANICRTTAACRARLRPVPPRCRTQEGNDRRRQDKPTENSRPDNKTKQRTSPPWAISPKRQAQGASKRKPKDNPQNNPRNKKTSPDPIQNLSFSRRTTRRPTSILSPVGRGELIHPSPTGPPSRQGGP